MGHVGLAVAVAHDAQPGMGEAQCVEAANLLFAAPVRARQAPFEALAPPAELGADDLVEAERCAQCRHVQVWARGHQHQVIACGAVRRDRLQRSAEQLPGDDSPDVVGREPRDVFAREAAECSPREGRLEVTAPDAVQRVAQDCRQGEQQPRQPPRPAQEEADHEREEGIASRNRPVEIEDRQAPCGAQAACPVPASWRSTYCRMPP